MDYQKKIFAVITGASKGIGQALAVELSKTLCDGSTITLIARNLQALNEVKATAISNNPNINVNVFALDLSRPDIKEFESILSVSDSYDYALIFHNAGQIGLLNATIELTDLQAWRDYFDLNFFSVGILNSVFAKHLRKMVTQHLIVVNISSLCGLKPFNNMAMYGAAKAARNIYFQVFASEESDVKVLNYCPGPVDTAMVSELIDNVKDEGIKQNFVNLKETKVILTPSQTVKKLLRILEEGKYKSGDVIDYFDRE